MVVQLSVVHKQQLTRIRNILVTKENECTALLTQIESCQTTAASIALEAISCALVETVKAELSSYVRRGEMWDSDISKIRDDAKRTEEEDKRSEYYEEAGENATPSERDFHLHPILFRISSAVQVKVGLLNRIAQMEQSTSHSTPQRTPPDSPPPTSQPNSNPLMITAELKPIESSLPSFTGEAWRWNEFWVQFTERVDQRQSLSDAHKLGLLRKCLEEEPLMTIEDFQLSDSNYKEAVDLLKRRYGNVNDAKLQLHNKVENLNAKSRSWDDQMTLLIRLRPLLMTEYIKLTKSKDHTAVYRMILGKFTEDILRPVIKSSPSDSMDILKVLSSIEKELDSNIRARNTLSIGYNGHTPSIPVIPSTPIPSQQTLRDNSKTGLPPNKSTPDRNCIFCGKHPNSNQCHSVQGHENRVRTLTDKGYCYRCLALNHKADQCNKTCGQCKGPDHFITCTVKKADIGTPVVLSLTEKAEPATESKGPIPSHEKSKPSIMRLWAGEGHPP